MALRALDGAAWSSSVPSPVTALHPHKPFSFLPVFSLPPPSPPLRLNIPPLKAQATPEFSAISSPSPLFLPHLQFDEEENDLEQAGAEAAEEEEEEDFDEGLEEDEEEVSDPILDFFKSRSSSSAADPKQEGRLSLQRNRRTSWRIANVDLATNVHEEELVFASPSDVIEPPSEDGVIGEILNVARNLPENTTLRDFLGSYVGRLGEGECIELLGRMGEEGMAWGCLYLFEAD